jgi:uncharacterized protein YbjT (DUF2867 family)
VILITAATGQVGSQTAQELLRAGTPVTALVRDPSRATALSGAEVVAGSFEDDASLARALDGVDAMLLAGRDSPDAVAQHRRVLDHARRAGVGHIVKLSAIGAAPASPVALMREHHEVDEEVRQGPAKWTLLKPHLFMQNLLRAPTPSAATASSRHRWGTNASRSSTPAMSAQSRRRSWPTRKPTLVRPMR